MEKRLVLDLDYCVGCQSCETACRAAFKGEARIRYGLIPGQAFLPLACRHCRDALCLASCPEQALARDERTGVVFRRSFRCTGCRNCIYACPFGVLPVQLVRHATQKCDLCRDRADGPRCAASCASGALRYETVAEQTKAIVNPRFVSRSPFWRRT